jgi:peptidyl-prolyl cis-trans isomerase SurA
MRMRSFVFVFLSSVLSSVLSISALHSQKDPVLMTVGGESVHLGEFSAIFKKNNQEPKITRAALDSYMDLFTIFKLKVREAREMGLDTSNTFEMELNSYVKQLTGPYLRDTADENSLLRLTYARMQKDRKVAHILVRVASCASPADTLAARKKIERAAMEIKSGKKKFAEVAAAISDDTLSGSKGGVLGWVTAPGMALPFEDAVYGTPVGQVSGVVRTAQGYHLIQVQEERPAYGRVKVAHIFVSSDMDDPVRKKLSLDRIQQAIANLNAGESWPATVRIYSENYNTAAKNGELPPFGINTYGPEIEEVVFKMTREGEVSAPVETPSGYHVFKLLEKSGVPPFDAFRGELQRQLSKTSRWDGPRKKFIDGLKRQYAYKENTAVIQRWMKEAGTEGILLRSSLTQGGETLLFSFADQQRTLGDFALYVEQKVDPKLVITSCNFIKNVFDVYVSQELLAYKETRLPDESPAFRYLVNEYREGILLFALMDQMVWKRSVRDSAGLEAFHAAHAGNYMWGPRREALIIDCKDEVAEAQARKLAPRLLSGKWNSDRFLKTLNKKIPDNIMVFGGLYAQGDQAVVDALTEAPGVGPTVRDGKKIRFAVVTRQMPAAPKLLRECRGQATSDYSNWLEQDWVKGLRAKYPVTVNREVLYQLADD